MVLSTSTLQPAGQGEAPHVWLQQTSHINVQELMRRAGRCAVTMKQAVACAGRGRRRGCAGSGRATAEAAVASMSTWTPWLPSASWATAGPLLQRP